MFILKICYQYSCSLTHLAYFRKSILFGKHNGRMRWREETQIVVTRSMYQGLCVQYKSWAANKKTGINLNSFPVIEIIFKQYLSKTNSDSSGSNCHGVVKNFEIHTLFPLVANDDEECYACSKTISHNSKCTQSLSIFSTDRGNNILVC